MGAMSSKADGKKAELVTKLIKENPVVVFSATWCPFCTKAKTLLKSVGADFKVVEIDVEKNGNDLRKGLQAHTGRTSVPAIFVGSKFIGGCNDGPGVVPLHSQGKLVPMLKKVNAL
mmetsp:Transcript_33274/g.80792  ORF Transcript_33274/g.80792 Transcript_33274/m.80792 type:complete len:116 (-) Transcript_33274:179-526(-)